MYEQRNNAKQYYNLIKNSNIIKYIKYDNKHVWHRFPIWVEDISLYSKIVNVLSNTDLEYQLLHETSLVDLKRNKHCIRCSNKKDSKYVILLRTRNVNINMQIEILKEILSNIVA